MEGELGFFPTAEGYVRRNVVKNRVQFNYIYNYTDHLGNTRVSYTKDPLTTFAKIVEENHYYPFGLKHANYNSDQLAFQPNAQDAIVLDAFVDPLPLDNYINYNYKFQGQERQDEFGLGWDSFKWRNYDPAIGRFMSIDPLAEKYPHNGVYNFSENRVIDGRELEGLEVVLINPTKSSSTQQQKAADQRIVNGAKNIPNSSTMITVTGHGSPTEMSNDVRGENVKTAGQLNSVLNRNSNDWKNKESGEGITVVLYSCRTGADEKNKDGSSKTTSFAQTISSSKEFKDVEIVAPDQRVYFNENGPVGTYEAKYAGADDNYKSDAKDHSRSENPGNWNVFKNGELIRSYQGDWEPTDNPSFLDGLFKQN